MTIRSSVRVLAGIVGAFWVISGLVWATVLGNPGLGLGQAVVGAAAAWYALSREDDEERQGRPILAERLDRTK